VPIASCANVFRCSTLYDCGVHYDVVDLDAEGDPAWDFRELRRRQPDPELFSEEWQGFAPGGSCCA
jgi:hypothetical protein